MDFKFSKRKLLIAFLLLSAISFYFLDSDEEVDPSAAELIKTINSEISTENNGMVFLLGMWTAQELSPYQVGLSRIENFELTRTQPNSDRYNPLEDYKSEMWLEEIDDEAISPITCNFREKPCVEFVWSNASEIPALLGQYEIYLNRLDQLLQYESFSVPTKPHISSPMVFHQAYTFAVKLKLLEIVNFAKSGDFSSAATNLSELIELNLNLLENSPDLFTKVIAVVHHEQTLEIAAFLLTKTPKQNVEAWRETIDVASQFKTTAASNKRQLGIELVAFINAIHAHPEFLNFHDDSGIQFLPKSLLYKPNMTLNLFFETLMKSVDVYVWKEGKIQLVKTLDEKQKRPSTQLTNFIGSTFVQVATPRYLNIEREILELYFRNEVYKASFKERLNGLPITDKTNIKSPYTGKNAYSKDGLLCADGDINKPETLCFYF